MLSFFSPKTGWKKASKTTPKSETKSKSPENFVTPTTNASKARVTEKDKDKVKKNMFNPDEEKPSPLRRSPRKRSEDADAAASPAKKTKRSPAKSKASPAKTKAKKSPAKKASPKRKATTTKAKKPVAKDEDEASPVVGSRSLRKRKRITYDAGSDDDDDDDDDSGSDFNDDSSSSSSSSSSDDDDGSESEEEEPVKRRRKPVAKKPAPKKKAAPAKRKKRICDDDDDDDNEDEDKDATNNDGADGDDGEASALVPKAEGDVLQHMESFAKGASCSTTKDTSAKARLRREKIANEEIKDTEVAAGTENSENLDLSQTNFCEPDKIRDFERRRPDHPDYDSRTLHIPAAKWKEFSPAQTQYWKIKQQNWDVVLFFKVGKFYELFDMDAHVGVKELGLTYMKAARPHSGFPESAVDKYAEKLVHLGFKVGRVEQVETKEELAERNRHLAKKEKAVKRAMCSILTPGTLVDPNIIAKSEAVYILSLIENHTTDEYGVCFLDTGSGQFRVGQFKDDKQRTFLRTLLAQIRPQEVLFLKDGLTSKTNEVLRCELPCQVMKTAMDKKEFWGPDLLKKNLAEGKYFSGVSDTNIGELDEGTGFPHSLANIVKDEKEWALTALGGCVCYLKRLLLDKELVSLGKFETYQVTQSIETSNVMVLDGQTLQNLEILQNTEGGSEGSLLKQLDHTKTAFGKRRMREWVSRPLRQIAAMNERLDCVEYVMHNRELCNDLTQALKGLPDLERLLSRVHANGLAQQSKAIMYENVSARKINVFLKVLKGFKQSMAVPALFKTAREEGDKPEPAVLKRLTTLGEGFADITEELKFFEDAFDHKEAAASGFIKPTEGVDEEYDMADADLMAIIQQLDEHLQEQKDYFKCRDIKYVNRGKEIYQLEIPLDPLKAKGIPDDFKHLGATKKNKRYHTETILDLLPELQEAQLNKEKLLKDITRRMFCKFCEHYTKWADVVEALSTIDCFLSLAMTSAYQEGASCRPVFVEEKESTEPQLCIRGGVHPALASTRTAFIPNDTVVGAEENPAKFVLVSGPNMGGKSTLLRQTCAIVIMAQLGCYVPAESCCLTPIDRIFTRVGANDRIMQGQSTFLVELQETANILRHATSNSLIILDELGRGTSTFDGTAIAFSVIKFLCEKVGCLSLFSTHYHMLMEDFAHDPRIAMYHMACNVEANQKDVTFLYKFIKGTCPKSYGMNVATLAGLPNDVVTRAQQMSESFEVLLERAHKQGKNKLLAAQATKLIAGDTVDLTQLRQLHKSLS